MRRQITPMMRPLCGCGCGNRLPPRKRGEKGRPRRWLNRLHRQRALRFGVLPPEDDMPPAQIDDIIEPEDDLTPAQIDAIIESARAQQRYVRATGGAA